MRRLPLVLTLALALAPAAGRLAADQQILPELPRNGMRFGTAVDASGDWAIAGAPNDHFLFKGSARILHRGDDGWEETASVLAGDGVYEDEFGSAVAIDDTGGVRALVGDWKHGGYAGAAYVFVLLGDEWKLEAELVAGDGAAGDQFGAAVALGDQIALVGAPGHSLGGVKSGAVYAFRRSGTIWSEIDRIVPDDPVISSWFGSAVALEGLGAVAVVGARHHRHDPYPAPASGAAYVFFRSGAHWSEEAELLPGDPHDEMEFGSSVAASFFGNRVIAGAPGMTGSDVRGAAYVFGLSASEWPQVAKLTSGAGEMRSGFATGVAMAGDGSFAVAGDPGSLDATGACFRFREAGGSWSRAGGWSPPRAALSTWAELGRSVAMAGTEIVAGAPGDDTAGADAGAVYVSGELLFADGFEGGDCSRWASVSD